MNKVFVVLLHWKDIDDTVLCIKSLNKISNVELNIIVVDNASNDGSDLELQLMFPEITVLVNDNNLGFSAGCNVGLKYALLHDAQYVLLLNNDIEVTKGFFDGVFELFESDNSIAAITGKIMYKDKPDIFWQAGGRVDPFRVQGISFGKGEVDKGQFDLPTLTGWASGAMSLFPRKTLDTLGFLPEEYFFGQEEWDYSTLILRNGYKIFYLPSMLAYHKAGGSYKAGHPILNIYGGYLNKVIYARKYINKYFFNFWLVTFFLYLTFIWPLTILRTYKDNSDRWLVYRAGLLALWDSKKIRKVNLDVLLNAAKYLGDSKNYNVNWAS